MSFFIVIILMLAVMWLLMIRPQRKRQQEQQRLLESLEPGDEVMTAGGIFGTIGAVRDDEIDLEIAPGTTIRIARRAVSTKLQPPAPEIEAEVEEEQLAETAGEPQPR